MLGIWLFHTNGHFQGQNSGRGREGRRGEGGGGRRREKGREGERSRSCDILYFCGHCVTASGSTSKRKLSDLKTRGKRLTFLGLHRSQVHTKPCSKRKTQRCVFMYLGISTRAEGWRREHHKLLTHYSKTHKKCVNGRTMGLKTKTVYFRDIVKRY